jgi:Ca2+-binding RTX toxin-like protein
LIGGTGADAMAGGTGNDIYYVDNVGDITFEWGAEGTDLVNSSITWTLAGGVENLTLTGSAISGTGNNLNNVITGTSGNNLLDGGEGDDTLNGGGGADTMIGGNGSDTYYVDNIGDAVLEAGPNGGFDIVNTAITLTMPTNVEIMNLIGSAPING